MAAEVEVQPGQVGGRLHLNPLTDSSNNLMDAAPPIITPEPGKPVLGPKPRLTPKPFTVERNATVKPIVAPKPPPKPRPEPTCPAGYKPGQSPKPHQPVAPGRPRPVSANFNRPAPTSFRTSSMSATGQTTKPVVQPFKAAPPLDLSDPSRPSAPVAPERQKPSNLTYSKSLKSRPAAEWSGTSVTDKHQEIDESAPSRGGGSMTRAKSLGFLVEVGKEEDKQNADSEVPLRPRPRAPRPRPVSAIFLDGPTKTETPAPAPRWTARRPLSADLTAKFESIGLSLHRSPVRTNAKDSSQSEKSPSHEREAEKTPKSTDGDQNNPNAEDASATESDHDKPAVSIKSRINLLLDSSASPVAAATDLPSPVQPASETEPPVGVKQLIKQLTVDTTPTQSPPVKPVKPRPLPSDLTKMFSSERLPDLGGVFLGDERHDAVSRDPQTGVEESAFGDQRTWLDSQEKPKTLPPAAPEAPEAGRTHGASVDQHTVRASLFENVVERRSVLMVDEGKPTTKGLLSSPSSKSETSEDDGTLVTAIYKEPPSPASPLRVVHAFDTVPAVEESRAVSENVPSAQWEDKAMTLRSRRPEGTRPGSTAMPQQPPRYLRIGALQKWTDAGNEEEKRTERREEQEEVAASPKRLKMLQAEEQLKPKATYFALTGQLQEPFPPAGTGASSADVGDFKPVLGSSQGGATPGRRNPSSQDPAEVTRSHKSHGEIRSAPDRRTTEEAMDVEKKRELKKEKERHKAKMKAMEREKQRQLELEREALLEFERMKEMERQREFERQRQKAFEKEKREFEEKQRALERQKQVELQKQKVLELERLEKERQRQQRELEKQRKAEREKLERERQREQERQRQREEERQRELDREKQLLEIQKEKQKMEELQRIKELEAQQLLEFQKQKQREKERQQLMELEKQRLQEKKEREEAEKVKQMALEQEMLRLREIDKERERQREMERECQKEMEREKQKELERQRQRELDRERQRQLELERQRQLDLERQRQLDLERQRQLDLERQRQLDLERQRQLDLERQRQLDLERQRQLDLERQELENQRLRQREQEKERQKKEELERVKETERRQLLEFEKQKQAERDRLREKLEREEADKMRQVARQQEAERQRLKDRQKEEEERSRLETSLLRPQVVDIDSVFRNDQLPKSSAQRSDPATRWKEPSARPEESYRPAILDIDSFTAQAQHSVARDLFPVSGIQGGDAGLGARLQPERDISWKVPQQTSLGALTPGWTTSPQDPWDLLSAPVQPAAPQPTKQTNKVSPEQLLLHFPATQKVRSSPLDDPLHWDSSPAGGASSGAAAEQKWFPRELLDSGGGVVSRRRSQGSQDLNRMRSRSVSRRSAPPSGAVEAGLSRLRSRSAHREQDRHGSVQQKQSNGVEEERRSGGETSHQETDSQYGTWETGLRTDDSLTPATPSSDSNLSPSPRKPASPQTPGDPASPLDGDTVDSVPPSEQESHTPSFPDAPVALLDTSVLRSRAQLAKKRAPRTRPTRATRQTTAAPEGGATNDWLYRDSTEPKAEGKDEDEEEPRGAESSSAAAQPQRVALFPGMDPSALKAQLKKRGESDNQTDGPAPPTSQVSRSPKSPFLPGAARVLPPAGGKETSEEDSPQWLKELKSKKRLSQFEMES
ncbi:titin homolog isoform X2 [Antennarius striatus]|uniref:titin homolog isoform X2 n=1 Tax=Antennarius striatus TaxID=241820 RepID=UPI0035AEDC56